MNQPLEPEQIDILARLRHLRRLAWLALYYEQIMVAYWRVLFCVLGFGALWLLRIPAAFGRTGSTIALLTFIAGIIYFIYRGIKDFRAPTAHDVDRRLEKASALKDRPLAQFEDHLANPEKEETRSLWQRGRDEAIAMIRKMRPFWPNPTLAAHDPYALRILIILLLAIGIYMAGPTWKDRIGAGLMPYSIQWEDKVSDNIVLWVTPPGYTNIPPVTIQGHGTLDKTITIPEGSVVKARIRGGLGTPYLEMGNTKIKLSRLGGEDAGRIWGLETNILAGDVIKVKQLWLTRAIIPVNFIADAPPEISLRGKPEILSRGSLQIPLTLKDDYGVSNLIMRMKPDPDETYPMGHEVEETRAIMSVGKTEQNINPVYDLTWHSWAGMKVIIELEAEDGLQHKAALEPIKITLPERPFYNQTAKKLIEMRKRIILAPDEAPLNISYEIETIMSYPKLYDGDPVVFLGLRSAASRLIYAPEHDKDSIESIVPLLWDIALRIEEGDLTLAARDLRESREALEKLLNDPNATDEQIAQATAKLQSAMVAYFQELYKELQKQIDQGKGPQISPEQLGQTLDTDDLSNFFAQMQAEALSGDRNKARRMLSQLQQFMDQLDPSMSMELPPEVKYMQEAVEKMKELIDKQQALLDETQSKARQTQYQTPGTYAEAMEIEDNLTENWDPTDGMPPQPQDSGRTEIPELKPEPLDTSAEKTRQDELRRALGDLMLQADEALETIAESMQSADKEMRESAQALSNNNADQSIPHQEAVLNHLQNGEQEMTQQLAEMMKNMTMMSFGASPTDPLGRPLDNGNSGLSPNSSVEIPEQGERKHVQEILKLLRQRSGEMNRPDYELDYLRRLMKQF